LTLTGLFDRDRFQRLIDGVHRSSAALPAGGCAGETRHGRGARRAGRAAAVVGVGGHDLAALDLATSTPRWTSPAGLARWHCPLITTCSFAYRVTEERNHRTTVHRFTHGTTRQR